MLPVAKIWEPWHEVVITEEIDKIINLGSNTGETWIVVNGQAGATSCRTWGAIGEKVDFLRKKGARCLTSSTMLIEWLFKKIFCLDKF